MILLSLSSPLFIYPLSPPPLPPGGVDVRAALRVGLPPKCGPPLPPPLQVVWMSGLPSEWGSPPSVDPPDSVVARTHDYLDLLGNKILGYKVCV